MILSEEHLLLKKTVRERMEAKDIAEMIAKYERHDAPFSWEFVGQIAELGLTGINIPHEYCGAGMDSVSGVIAMMEMSRIWPGGALIPAVGNSLVSYPLVKYGAPHQKNKWLPKLAKGEILGSFCLTEPDHGSDAAHIGRHAKVFENGWLINGEACFITNAPVASFLIVFCRTDRAFKDHRGISGFLISTENKNGLILRKPDQKAGLHAAHMGSISFADVEAPFDSLVGEYGRGFSVAMGTLDHGRNWIGAQAAGGLNRCRELAERHANERTAFGSAIIEHSGVFDPITDMAFAADVSTMLLFYSASLEDRGEKFGQYASLAKLFSSEQLKVLKGKAQDIYGGAGFLLVNEISRVVADCDVFTIYEGASNVQRNVILKAWLDGRLDVYPKPPYTHLFSNLRTEADELGGKDALKQRNQRRLFEIADIIPYVAAWHIFDNIFSKEWPCEFMNFKDPAIFADILLDETRCKWPWNKRSRNDSVRDAAAEHLRKNSRL